MYRSALPILLSLFILACSSEGGDETRTVDSAGPGNVGEHSPASAEDENTGRDKEYAIVADSIIRMQKRPKYEVRAIFPQLEGTEEAATEQRFNGMVRDSVRRMVEEFVSFVEETDEELPLPEDEGMQSAFDLTYQMFLKNERGVSVGLENYTSYHGAAHPNTVTFSFLFDVERGRFLALKDLFRTDAHYLDTIARIAVADLMTREVSDEGWIREGAGPAAENYGTFFVTPDSLIIHFNAYQVAPYVAGAQQVGIAWKRLQGLLDPNGIAGALIDR